MRLQGRPWRGHCIECGQAYPSELVVPDGICPNCKAFDPQNDPSPYVEGPTWKYSKANLRERLGVTGDRDE